MAHINHNRTDDTTTNYPFNMRYLIGISFISALGGYLFGFDFAVIAGALPFLQQQFQLDAYWEGFATGSLALGAIVGCLVAGKLSDKYGRRSGLLTAAIIFAISSLAMASSTSRDIFIGARFCAGIGVGMASMLSPMYIAVISLWLGLFTFPILFESFREKSFYIYAFICALGFVFVKFSVKETKGRTLEELEESN